MSAPEGNRENVTVTFDAGIIGPLLAFGSLVIVAATMPPAFFRACGNMVEDTELETKLIRNSGFQPTLDLFDGLRANSGAATRTPLARMTISTFPRGTIVGSVPS